MTTSITLDLAKESTPIVIFAKQNDSARIISARIMQNGIDYLGGTGLTAVCRVVRANGTGMSINISNISTGRNTIVTVNLPAAALSIPGMARAEISLTLNGSTITTQSFYINVRGSVVS